MFFLHKIIWHKEICTHRLHTEVFTDFYRPTFVHAETLHSRIFFAQKPLRTNKITHNNFYRQTAFTHRKFSAQKGLQFTHNIFYIPTLLRTDVFTQSQTQIAHRNLCTQHAFTHGQFLHREALFPLLDHLPFVFPLSNIIWEIMGISLGCCMIGNMEHGDSNDMGI